MKTLVRGIVNPSPRLKSLLQKVLCTYILDETINQGVGSATRTYVCQKLLG